jgi:DNA invertase Pin-like site-specific DNA recombinase
LKHLIESIDALHAREVGFRSLTEAIDTTTPAGRLQFHIFGALAEFEREIIRERTRAGLAAARARGRLGGRPSSVSAQKLAAAEAMRARQHSMRDIAAALGVSRPRSTAIWRAAASRPACRPSAKRGASGTETSGLCAPRVLVSVIRAEVTVNVRSAGPNANSYARVL